jgi:hypothetical protein
MRFQTAPRILAGILLPGLLLGATPALAHAQIGGLIKKKIEKVSSKDAVAQSNDVKFDNETLELTPERIAKVVAGERAAKEIAEGPDGPAAIEKKIAPLDERQTAIYLKHVDEINGWDNTRMDFERCRDDSMGAVKDRLGQQFEARMRSDPDFRMKLAQLAMNLRAAQQKGDSATAQRLEKELENMRAPTKADSAAVDKLCGGPPPMPALVAEYFDLMRQLKALKDQLPQAEARIQIAKEKESGMTQRQLAISCERIKMFREALEKKVKKPAGYTDQEREALEQAIKDLKEICP